MNKLILLSLFALFSLSGIAQKAKNRSVEFKYYHLPSDPLSGAVSKYAVIVNNTSTKVKIGNARIKSYLNLQGFEKITPSSAGVILEFSVYGVQTNVDIETEEVKEKVDDKEVKKTKYYYYISSKTSSKFVLKYKSGTIIKSMNFNGGDFLYTHESGLYDTKAEAQKALNSKKTALLINADDSGLELVLETVKKYLDDHHAYYYLNKYESIATGKGKKYDYTELDEAVEVYKEAAAEYGVKGVSEGFIIKSNECIDVWKSAISEYDANDKKARISKKNIDRFYWNVAVAYFYMNEFDKAVQTLNEAMTVGKSTASEKYFIGQIKNRKNRYKLNEKRKLEANSTITSNLNKNIGGSVGKAVAISLKGINPNFRVKKVTKKYHSGINDYIETTYFYYEGNRLKYKIKNSKSRVDSIVYSYSHNKINEKAYYSVKSKGENWIKDEIKGVTYDILNRLITKRTKRGEELIYKYNSQGGLVALIRHTKNYYDDLMYKYTFHFNNNKLDQIKTFRFFEGEWKEHKDLVLNFNHSNSTVKIADRGFVYKLDYSNGLLLKIQKYNNFNIDKEDLKYIFKYDSNGNIIEQSFKNTYGNVETYEIEYEQKEGNEEMFLGTKDWAINTYFHQITFNEYFEVSY